MKIIKSVYIFDNGNIAVFDDKNKQVPELQINILSWMKEKGYNVICDRINVTR
jgi:hypothetical protein